MSRIPVHLSLSVAALSVAALLLGGCGAGVSAGPGAPELVLMHGTVHGGANPIVGATVKLMVTNTTATGSTYGTAANTVDTATTNGSGGFVFPGANNDSSTNCPTGQYAYISVSGGSTGAFSANKKAVLMSVLGACGSFTSSTTIFINELSSVAGAYALGNFISVTGSAGAQTVNIGAPATNAAATPSCTLSATFATTACTAGGLGHAFAIAAALVNSVGTSPTGTANTAFSTNSTSSIPQALLNTLGNIMQSCVNSDGTNTSCTSLFSNVTPFALSGTAVAPTDTLSAMVDIAKSPATNVSTLYGLSTPSAFFNPALASQPTDFSLAVFYGGADSTATGLYSFPVSLALDIADSVYVQNAYYVSGTINNSYTSGIYYNGTEIFTPTDADGTATPVALVAPNGIATDTQGHVWVIGTSGSNAVREAHGYSTSTGALQEQSNAAATKAYSAQIAVDRSNNLWYAVCCTAATGAYTGSTVGSLGEIPISTTTGAIGTAASATVKPLSATGFYNLTIDNLQNVWAVNPGTTNTNGTANATLMLFENTGTSSSPTYAATSYLTSTLSTTAYGVKPTVISSVTGVAIDSSGSAWTPLGGLLTEVTATPTGGPYTGLGSVSSPSALTATFPAAPAAPEFDGSNVLWFPNYDTSNTVSYYVSGASGTVNLSPCYAASGATTCDATHLQYGSKLQVDSTGSVWVAAGGKTGATAPGLVEIIGTAAPTWPQLSWGALGVKP